jgi:hypothetical protein
MLLRWIVRGRLQTVGGEGGREEMAAARYS